MRHPVPSSPLLPASAALALALAASSSPDPEFKIPPLAPKPQTLASPRPGPPPPAGRARPSPAHAAGPAGGTCGVPSHGDRARSDLLNRGRRRTGRRAGGRRRQEGSPHRQLERRGASNSCSFLALLLLSSRRVCVLRKSLNSAPRAFSPRFLVPRVLDWTHVCTLQLLRFFFARREKATFSLAGG